MNAIKLVLLLLLYSTLALIFPACGRGTKALYSIDNIKYEPFPVEYNSSGEVCFNPSKPLSTNNDKSWPLCESVVGQPAKAPMSAEDKEFFEKLKAACESHFDTTTLSSEELSLINNLRRISGCDPL